jgi:hypothetical protein
MPENFAIEHSENNVDFPNIKEPVFEKKFDQNRLIKIFHEGAFYKKVCINLPQFLIFINVFTRPSL